MTRIVCYLFSKDALELIYPKITDYPTPIFRYYNSEIEDRILTLSFDE